MIAVAGSHSVLMTEGWAGRGAAGEGDNRQTQVGSNNDNGGEVLLKW
jgi:hypothetical protein